MVHDYLDQAGGAERVLAALAEAFPGAPVFTSIVKPSALSPELRKLDIRPSFAQRLPGILEHKRVFLPVYPMAMESLKLDGYDVILSSSSAFANGCRVPKGSLHISYCHTPMRVAWRMDDYLANESLPMSAKLAARAVVGVLRRWDVRAAKKVHRFIANSSAVRDRIRNYYGRDAEVVYPPVDVDRFAVRSGEAGNRFLVVSRLVAYKRIDLAVRSCTQHGLGLDVVGTGPDLNRLRALAGTNVTFHGFVPDKDVAVMMRGAKAVIFPGEEDFGIVPVEANACGCPVVAFRAGGALDTIVDGVNGVFFDKQGVDDLAVALKMVDRVPWDPGAMRKRAEAFNKKRFLDEIRSLVAREWVAWLGTQVV